MHAPTLHLIGELYSGGAQSPFISPLAL